MSKIQRVKNTETPSEEMEGDVNWKGINSTEKQQDDKLLNGKLMQDTQ